MSWKTIPLLSIFALAALAAAAQDPPGRPAAEPSRGAILYRLHCASCHGPEGRGDGPVAAELKRPPADLTRIARRRGGRFPAEEVERIIDGRSRVEAHGRTEMPVWGLSFRDPGRLDHQEDEVRLQIRHLVRYLRSLQTGKVADEEGDG